MRKFLLLALSLLFIGCNDTPTLYNSNNYQGEPIQITDGVYFKKVYIQGMYVLLQCDALGKIIHGQTTNMGYQEGKVFKHSAILTTNNVPESQDGSFTFKCSDINDCYNQVIIVKNSISK